MKQHSKMIDTLVGLFVASGILALTFLSLKVSNLVSFNGDAGYTISARFQNSGGLKVKSPVSVAGVKIGRITDIRFDNESFESIVKMEIENQYKKLPDDTTASIFTAGLLGEQFISLDPGGSDTVLEEGSEIEITQSALVLEEIIGQFLFSKTQE